MYSKQLYFDEVVRDFYFDEVVRDFWQVDGFLKVFL
jgi:hypothetical protein